MKKHTYVLGTATSHNGSACLLKDGKICVAIEKERLTRIKHEGGNDRAAIEYCLKAENITIHDLDLVVQNANFGSFKFGNNYMNGPRPFGDQMEAPVITISHHLAHSYSTVGTCPFDKYNILIMDGCGNSFDDCMDLENAFIPDLDRIRNMPHLFNEKDSYYKVEEGRCFTLIKDFSEWGYGQKNYPMHPSTTKHSIGGIYASASLYCFGNIDDVGKLMGLGPYGRSGVFKERIFDLKDGRAFVNYDWMETYRLPVMAFSDFKKNFQYYADIAHGIQEEIERAILYIVRSRLEAYPAENLCYSGGTALNAVANAKILDTTGIDRIYIEPAAGDNGLALGCAYYGWLEILKKEKVRHDGSTCFGVSYAPEKIKDELDACTGSADLLKMKKTMDIFFVLLNSKNGLSQHMKANIQFNIEDFGVYQVLMGEDIRSGSQLFGKPTCIVRADGKDFYKAMSHRGVILDMIRSGKIRVSNMADLELLFKNVNLEKITQRVREEMVRDLTDKETDFEYVYSEDYIEQTARLLANGKVVGWFQDGCEFGARALGRRSILADPRNQDIRKFINAEIKFREDFRPFAPSVLREDVAIYFETNRESPYMILVDYIREEYREKLKSIVHENQTSRIQTVTPEWNPKYYQLLKEFKKITGISVLLNTSLNRKGMPIVETPREALDLFFTCKLDYLVMDKYIISKKQAPSLSLRDSVGDKTIVQAPKDVVGQ